ncbi:hypothetical protein PUW24_21140 [Paenibacillus urinalis]|uniref:DUF4352 domain-containing protein n=1 Tax=Paenibacillus urinalis TaxID=521520 RepID=A0AAX3MT83_9BACL|nr:MULTISPECIES: hypothetical protein [Paenibacillus]WDH80593.1 hypothetical protein PUW23_13590 [Paenibacillus urinalis]WDH96640.1 hypothetical protein PUW24_21140 [Paenibacillus urinalis]WDI00284.1 hypothetical protein PUW25_13295 [Paenibacillus urinalis]GAK40791.1 hypothetical protein TCA2_3281 [Paenibacillus sp. TCA20]
MQKLPIFTVIALSVVLLVGCGNEVTNIKDDNPTEAKMESNSNVDSVTSTESEGTTTTENVSEETENSDDIWTYYNDATWSDDFNGVVTTIEKVVVSDKAPKDGDTEDLTASAVGIKMNIENTTDKIFTTYPDQAELITSTGEQVDANMWLSDNLGGEIEEGVIKEGNVIWFLDRGNAEDIEWVKIKWYITEGDGFGSNDQREEYSVKLQLK